MEEVWRLAPMNSPHYGHYWVSNLGRVKNEKGRILKGGLHNKGYHQVCVKLEGVQSTYKTHRLVAIAFIDNPNPEKYNQINHIDGNKLNNRVDNLEWCDDSRNQQHKVDTGLWIPTRGNEYNGNRKLTEEEVIEIYLAQGTAEFIAIQYKVSRSTVWSIKEGRNWSWLTKDLKTNNEENDINE